MKTETKTTGRRWSRRAITMAVIGGLFVVAIAAAAFAFVQARAEVEGSVSSGTASLEWQTSTGAVGTDGGTGLISGDFLEYDVDGTTMQTMTSTIPNGVTAEATVEGDGTLTLDVSGLFSGEGIALRVKAKNASTLGIGSIALDFTNADAAFGPNGSGATYELWFAYYDGSGWQEMIPNGTIAAGDQVFGQVTFLIVEMDKDATADGATVSATGIALVGLAEGGR